MEYEDIDKTADNIREDIFNISRKVFESGCDIVSEYDYSEDGKKIGHKMFEFSNYLDKIANDMFIEVEKLYMK